MLVSHANCLLVVATCVEETVGAVDGVIELNTSMKNFSEALLISSMAEAMGIDSNRIVVVDIEGSCSFRKFAKYGDLTGSYRFVDISPPFCPECTTIDLRANNYTIPATTTYYSCRGFEIPVTGDQIIKIEPLKDNTLVLHHMVRCRVMHVLF